jgi:hypothetical protein
MGMLRLSMIGGVGLVCLLALGCNRDEPIKAYQAPREAAHVHHERLEWKTPANWIEWPGADEQTLSGFTVEDGQPPLELTITALPRQSPSAADVTANVNRWQRQLEMPGSSKEEVETLAKKVMVGERPVFVVDLLGPARADQKRILGGMSVEGDRVWFFKLMGAAARVEKHKSEFDQLISSLKFNGPAYSGPQRETKGRLSWITPAGWENGGEKAMRELTLFAGDANDPAEVIVTSLGGAKFGDLLDNVNRWRAQVGLTPVSKVEEQPSERMQLAGNPAAYFDMSGPGNADKPNQRMLLVMSVIDGDAWFIKMIGPQKVVASEKSDFEEFLKSIQIVK